MQENMSGNIKTILEYVSVIPGIQGDIKDLKKGQEKLTNDVEILKIGQKIMQGDIKTVQGDIREINRKLDKKVDREEFQKLERQVLHAA